MLSHEELRALKKKLYRWAKEKLRGCSVTNEATGNTIEISAQGIDEWYSKSKSEEQIKSISLLAEILQKAKLTHRAENAYSKRKNAPSFEYYECPIEIEEKGFNAVVSVKIVIAAKDNRRIYYHHYLDDIKNQTVLNSSAPT